MSASAPYRGRVLPSLRGADLSVRAFVESTTSFGIFVKFLLFEVTLFYCLSYIEGIEEHLGITPGSLIPSFKIWTLFTYALIDVHIWNLMRNWLFIFLAGKYVQPLWGDLELLLFYLITNTISGLWVTLLYLISFMSLGNEEFLFETRICGLSAFIGGVFVALKQLLPEEVISSLPFLHIRVKHLPFTAFIVCVILTLSRLTSTPTLLLFTCGMLVSWIYLRFYQLHSSTRGDLSDGFTFASFFPEIAQPVVAIVANTLHAGLVRVGICRKMVRRYDVGAASSSANTLTLQMTPAERADNDRRRHLALKALSERLGHGSGSGVVSSSMDSISIGISGGSTDNVMMISPTSLPASSSLSAVAAPTSATNSVADWPLLDTSVNSKNSGSGATQLDTVVSIDASHV